jgi:hypothetical protein
MYFTAQSKTQREDNLIYQRCSSVLDTAGEE